MMKKLSILAILALLLAACGTTQQNNGNSAGNQATAVEALETSEQPTQGGDEKVVDDVSQKEDLGIGFGFVPGIKFFDQILQAPIAKWDCEGSSASGDVSDADDDGIAKNATYTILCTKSFANFPGVGSAVEVKREGKLTMQDKDDNDPTSGYIATGDFTYSYTVMGQEFSAHRTFKRDWTGTAAKGYSFNHIHTWTWSAAGHDYKVEHAHNGSYKPDDADKPFDAGDLQETGSIKHSVDSGNLVTVSETANLHLNASCTPPADSGTIKLTVNGSTKTITFSGCGNYNVQ